MLTPDDEARAIEALVERLTARFAETAPETVRAIIFACYDDFKGKPIRDFVPVLVERSAKDRLIAETGF